MAAVTTRAEDLWRYRVAPGDTLSGIAALHLLPRPGWPGLQRFNRIDEPRRLQPGTELRAPVAWLKGEPASAEVLFVHGSVQAAPRGGAPAPVRAGQRLAAGTTVTTGAQSSLVLRLGDGSRLLVRPDTRATLETLLAPLGAGAHRSDVRLRQGGIESTITPQSPVPPFRVKTPVATLGVRGTEFRTRFDGGVMRVEVLEGAVAAGRVRVGAGLGTLADARGVQPPVPLLPAPEPTLLLATALQAEWPPLPGAVAYRAQLLGAEGSVQRDERLAEPALRWDLPGRGSWQLRVRAIDAHGLEGRDAERRVERRAEGGPAPEPRFPLPGSVVEGGSVAFEWAPAEPGRRHRLQVAASDDFAQPLIDVVDDSAAAAGLVRRDVALPPGRWYWRLATLGDDGTPGTFGAPQVFELNGPGQ